MTRQQMSILVGQVADADLTTVTTCGKWRVAIPKSPLIATPFGEATLRAVMRRRRNRPAWATGSGFQYQTETWEVEVADAMADPIADQYGYMDAANASWGLFGWQDGSLRWIGPLSTVWFQHPGEEPFDQAETDYPPRVAIPVIPPDWMDEGRASGWPWRPEEYCRYKLKVQGAGLSLDGYRFVCKRQSVSSSDVVVTEEDIDLPFAQVGGVWETAVLDLATPVRPIGGAPAFTYQWIRDCGIKDPGGDLLSFEEAIGLVRVLYKRRVGMIAALTARGTSYWRERTLRWSATWEPEWEGSVTFERRDYYDVNGQLQIPEVDSAGSNVGGVLLDFDTSWQAQEWRSWVQISPTLWRYTESWARSGPTPPVTDSPNPVGLVLEEVNLDLAAEPDGDGHLVTALQDQIGAEPGSAWYIEDVRVLPAST